MPWRPAVLKLKEAIVVEGKYDKISLEPLVDTVISAGWQRSGD